MPAYQNAAIAAVNAAQISGSPVSENAGVGGIEGKLAAFDSIVVTVVSGGINRSSPGLVCFVTPSDMVTSNLLSALGDSTTKTYRIGNTTGQRYGNVSSTSSGTLTFSTISQEGDSGGGYFVEYGGRSYLVGTHSGNGSSGAVGNYFSYGDWDYLNTLVTLGQAGNLTATEPVNLLVGSTTGETLTGSGRADIILGRDGNDTINGEFTIGAVYVWGDDLLYGGAGDDTINAYRGHDILHGGDRSLTVSQQSVLEADGSDTADYTSLTELDSSKGIAIQVTDQAVNATLAANVDAGFGTYVTDRGRGGDVDLLVSIEKVIATSADDVLVVTKFDAARLAGADGTGGLSRVDFGDHLKGDMIDLSGLNEAARVDLNGFTAYAGSIANPSNRIYVDGAERVLGSDFNDVIVYDGTARVTFAGGAGNDEIRGGAGGDYLFSGAGQDRLSGGGAADHLIASPSSLATLSGGVGADRFWLPLDLAGAGKPPTTGFVYRAGRAAAIRDAKPIFDWHGR